MKKTPKKEIETLSVNKKIDKLESVITKLIVTNNKRFDSIDNTLKAHNNRFESLENSIDQLAQMTAKGFSDADKRFDEFKAETEKNFVTVRRDILSANDRFVMQDTYFKKISLIETRLDNQDERITKIMNKTIKNAK